MGKRETKRGKERERERKRERVREEGKEGESAKKYFCDSLRRIVVIHFHGYHAFLAEHKTIKGPFNNGG